MTTVVVVIVIIARTAVTADRPTAAAAAGVERIEGHQRWRRQQGGHCGGGRRSEGVSACIACRMLCVLQRVLLRVLLHVPCIPQVGGGIDRRRRQLRSPLL